MKITMPVDNSQKALQMIRQNGHRALIAAGTEAVGCIKDTMEFRYGKPIKQTGTLMGSIAHGDPYGDKEMSIDVGTDVEYGKFVHEGTRKMIGRPFITDGLMNNKERIEQVIMQEMKRGFE